MTLAARNFASSLASRFVSKKAWSGTLYTTLQFRAFRRQGTSEVPTVALTGSYCRPVVHPARSPPTSICLAAAPWKVTAATTRPKMIPMVVNCFEMHPVPDLWLHTRTLGKPIAVLPHPSKNDYGSAEPGVKLHRCTGREKKP